MEIKRVGSQSSVKGSPDWFTGNVRIDPLFEATERTGPWLERDVCDVVWFSPNEKHWHGATPTTAMTHIAIQEALDSKVVDWTGKISDAEYQRT